MTEREAIKIFNKRMDCKDAFQADPSCDGKCLTCEYYTSAEEEKEAMQMAISALEKQEQDRWISCKERLPEEDKDVLITYRYKEGEGDTSHVYVDITTYGDMYFGGNPVHNTQNGNRIKHWRQPFAYFASNYEVIAWRPLPKAYRDDLK